jgi:hypothetical protein
MMSFECRSPQDPDGRLCISQDTDTSRWQLKVTLLVWLSVLIRSPGTG